jgi:NTP pyrophosphatase (non-canonical NTP hydrolase)
MNNYQTELLVILNEECGETVQEICKILRFGINEHSHHTKDKTHLQCLTQEMGDLLAMIELVMESDLGITFPALIVAKQKKLEKVGNWMKHKKPIPVVAGSVDELMEKVLHLAKDQLNNYKKVK